MKASRSTQLAHHRLDVHDAAQELAVACVQVTADLPRGFADLRDQARRAALATVRHIAEGASGVSPADKRARFSIARGEVAEVQATHETAALLKIVRSGATEDVDRLCARVAAMLMGLIRRCGGP